MEGHEEGEIQLEESIQIVEDNNKEEEGSDIREEDLIEDELLDQKKKDKEKTVVQKRGNRVQKTRA